MEKTLAAINDLEAMGLIRKYAIGGAVGLLFHAEPATTYDLDIFCFLPDSESVLVTLTPISDELKKRGYVEDKEHILIEGGGPKTEQGFLMPSIRSNRTRLYSTRSYSSISWWKSGEIGREHDSQTRRGAA